MVYRMGRSSTAGSGMEGSNGDAAAAPPVLSSNEDARLARLRNIHSKMTGFYELLLFVGSKQVSGG